LARSRVVRAVLQVGSAMRLSERPSLAYGTEESLFRCWISV